MVIDEQIDADVEFLKSQEGWQNADGRRDWLRDVAVKSKASGVPTEEHVAVMRRLWDEVDNRGVLRKGAEFVGTSVKEVAESAVAMPAAALLAGSDALGITDSGSGTRLLEGGKTLLDQTGQRLKQAMPGDSRQAERDAALNALREDLDAGAAPDELEAWAAGEFDGVDELPEPVRPWVDALTKGLGRKVVEADFMGDVTPEQLAAWQQSDRNPMFADSDDNTGAPGPREYLADYLATRDPSSWDGFVKRVTETEQQYQQRVREGLTGAEFRSATAAAKESGGVSGYFGGNLAEKAGQMQGSPIDLGSALLPVLRGAKALQAARAGESTLGRVLKGSGKEALQEGTTELLGDSRATAAEVGEAAAMGAIGSGVLEGGGAVVGSGLRALDRRNEAAAPVTVEGDMPGVVPDAGPATVEVDGRQWQYDPGQLTPDQVREATPEVLAQLQAAGLVSDAAAAVDTAAPDDGAMRASIDEAISSGRPFTPEEAEFMRSGALPQPLPATPTQVAPVETEPVVVGNKPAGKGRRKSWEMPRLPLDPTGSRDILNFLNSEPITIPPRGTTFRGGEYDFDKMSIPTKIRRGIFQQGTEPNLDRRAQAAYEAGLIASPTTDALLEAVNSAIANRETLAAEQGADTRRMADMERGQLEFEHEQDLLTDAPAVAMEMLAPGDVIQMGEQQARVQEVALDENGDVMGVQVMHPDYGPVWRGVDAPLRGELVQSEAPQAGRSMAEINAELAAWADSTIESSRGQMNMGLDPTVVAAYAVKAVQAGVQFAQWAAQMVRQFGAAVQQFLQGAWQAAKAAANRGAKVPLRFGQQEIARPGRSGEAGAINPQAGALNPNTTISARPPTMAEAMEGQVRQSQFGERVQADTRLTPELRGREPGQFAVQGDEQIMDQVAQVMRGAGSLEAAANQFRQDASLPMPVRIAGMSRVALNYDAVAAAARATGGDTLAADRATEAAVAAVADLEEFANEAGRNLRIFSLWARMSPDGQLRRLERGLDQANGERVRGDLGATVAEANQAMTEALEELDVDGIIAEAIAAEVEAGPVAVNPRTGGESLAFRMLGGLEKLARAVSESGTIQNMVGALDAAVKALSGRLFADPLLLTPMGKAVLTTTRTLLIQGQKLAAAVANAIADVRTRLNDTTIADVDMARAVTQAVTKEVVKPILRKLAFDANYNLNEAVGDLLGIGVDIVAATKLAKAVVGKRPKIAKIAQAKVRDAVMRKLKDKPRARARAQKLPAVMETLMQAVGAGFPTEKQFLDAWTAKYGLPTLSTAERTRLRDMAARVNLLPEGVLRQSAAIEFLNEVALIKGIPANEALVAAWYANVLSGVSTQAINVSGNGMMLMLKSLPLALSSPREAGKYLRGLGRGLRAGVLEAKAAMREGVTFRPGKFAEAQTSGALDLLVRQGPKSLEQWVAYVSSLGGLTRFFPRMLGAMDALFFYTANEGMAHLATARALRQKGLKPGSVAFNAEFVQQLGGDAAQWAADLDQAANELRAAGQAVPKLADVNRRAWELRRGRRSLEVQEKAKHWAERMTFTQPPEGAAAMLMDGILEKLQNFSPLGIPVGRLALAPFRGIVVNVADTMLDFSPWGIVRGVQSSRYTGKDKPRRMMDAVERRERILTGLMGTAVGYAMFALAQAVMDQDDDEVPFMVYGMGPPSKEAKAILKELGWRPYTIKVGDRYWSYAETPLGGVLAAFGHMLDSMRYESATPKTHGERLTLALLAGVQGFTRQGTLAQVADAVDVLTGDLPAKSLVGTAVRPFTGLTPVQGILRDVAGLFDKTKVSDEDVWGALVKDLPVVKSVGTRPALNWKGEPLQMHGAPILKRFSNPKRLDADSAFLAANRLKIPAMPETILMGQYIADRATQGLPLVESFKRRGLTLTALENGAMTQEQHDRFAKRSGELTVQGVERMRKALTVRYPRGKVPDEAREQVQARVRSITDAARRVAMAEEVQRAR